VGTDADVRWMVARTDDGGQTWEEAYLDPEPDGAQFTHLRFSPTDPDVIYAGRNDPAAVMRSDDGGASWVEVFDFPEDNRFRAVFAVADSGEDLLVAVSDYGRVWRKQAAGEWIEQSGIDSGVHIARQIGRQLVTDEGDPGSALFLSLEPPGLARSIDGAATWQRLSTPFGATILALGAAPTHPVDPTLLVATHYGAFYTCDEGETWLLLDRMVRHENFACSVRYEGSDWEHVTGQGTGTVSTNSATAGDAAEVEFWGRGVRWISSTGPDLGQADVFVDGALVEQVDLSAAKVMASVVVFEHDLGDDGFHTLRIQVAEGSTGEVDMDAVEVIRHRIENAPGETYEIGPWCEAGGDDDDDDDDDMGDDDIGDDDVGADDDSQDEGGCECSSNSVLASFEAPLALLAILGVLAVRRRRA